MSLVLVLLLLTYISQGILCEGIPDKVYSDSNFPSYKYFVIYCNTYEEDPKVTCDDFEITPIAINSLQNTNIIGTYIVPLTTLDSKNCSETLLSLSSYSVTKCKIQLLGISIGVHEFTANSTLIRAPSLMMDDIQDILNEFDTNFKASFETYIAGANVEKISKLIYSVCLNSSFHLIKNLNEIFYLIKELMKNRISML